MSKQSPTTGGCWSSEWQRYTLSSLVKVWQVACMYSFWLRDKESLCDHDTVSTLLKAVIAMLLVWSAWHGMDVSKCQAKPRSRIML